MKASEHLKSCADGTAGTNWTIFTAARYVAQAIEELTTEVRRMTGPKMFLCQRPDPASPGHVTLGCPEPGVREDEIDGEKVLLCQAHYDDRRE